MKDIEQIARQIFEGDEAISRQDLMTLAHNATMWRGIAGFLADELRNHVSPARAQELLDLLEFRSRTDIGRDRFNMVLRKLRELASNQIS